MREMGVQAVAGLRRFSVANAVRQDDEITRRVEKLAGTEEHSCKLRLKELLAATSGAVENQNRVRDMALRVARGIPQRPIVQPQFGQRFGRAEFEIVRDEIAFCRGRSGCLLGGTTKTSDRDDPDEQRKGSAREFHGVESSEGRNSTIASRGVRCRPGLARYPSPPPPCFS